MSRGKVTQPQAWLIVAALAGCADSEPLPRSGSAVPHTAAVESAFRAHLGRTWELERLGAQDIAALPAGSRVPRGGQDSPGRRPTIHFSDQPAPEGSVHPSGTLSAGGRSFCNAYGTAYEVRPGGVLRFHGFQSTLVGCDGPDSLETRFFRGLHQTRRVELDSARLALVAEDGSRLTFLLIPDSAVSPVR